jgi:hypothetical protein
MPQEFRQINGRWQVVGEESSSDQVPFEPDQPAKPTAAAPKQLGAQAILNGRQVRYAGERWGWQSLGAYQKLEKSGKLNPWSLDKLGNDLRYEAQQLGKNPLRSLGRAVETVTRDLPILPGGLSRSNLLGQVGALDNAQRVGIALFERHVQKKPKADPSATKAGALLDQSVGLTYQRLGFKPPAEQTPGERNRDMMRRSVMLNAGMVLVPGAGGAGALQAATRTGAMVRGGVSAAWNEILSNYLDDNTGGNIANLLSEVTPIKVPGRVNVGEDDLIDSANKSVVPNALFGYGLGAIAGGATRLFPNVNRRIRAGRAVAQQKASRDRLQAAGIIEPDETGELKFTQQAQQLADDALSNADQLIAGLESGGLDQFRAARGLPPEPAAAAAPLDPAAAPLDPAAPTAPPITGPEATTAPTIPSQPADAPFQDFGKAQPGDLPMADLAEDPWGIQYPPTLPEVDTLDRVIQNLDDAELVQVLQADSVVDAVNQAIETRPPVGVNPAMSTNLTAAHFSALDPDYADAYRGRLNALPDATLRSLTNPDINPEIFARAQGIAGTDWEEFSKSDMLDGIKQWSEDTGGMVLLNRTTPNAAVVPVDEIKVDPERFQFKQGTRADGVQPGGSLEGVDLWNPDAEGTIEVWRDPADGNLYVINGHNRVAKAKELGIPSLKVDELVAADAGEARRMGAISNISSGAGNAFDAAKFIRDTGMDPSKVQGGKPLASGNWAQGLALARLPEDVFLAAVNGQISPRKAAIIGDSGADEATMRGAYTYLVREGPDNVKEGRLREMLAQAQADPQLQAQGRVKQGGLLDGTEWDLQFNEALIAKADLADAVRTLLSREKKLFAGVAKNAGALEAKGNTIDRAGAGAISADNARAINVFETVKYQTGPVADLLSEGAARIVAGEQPGAIASQIKNRMAGLLREAIGQDAGFTQDAVQADIFATPAEPVRPEPETLQPEQRQALQIQAIQKAVANGEVRPPSTPIPDLTDAPRSTPAEAIADINARDGAVEPGSRAAEVVADEVRLAVDHARADADLRRIEQDAAREAAGYDLMTFDEKIDAGMAEGWDAGPSIADMFEAQMREMAQSDARTYRALDKGLSNIKAGLAALEDPALPAAATTRPIPALPPGAGAGAGAGLSIKDAAAILQSQGYTIRPARRSTSSSIRKGNPGYYVTVPEGMPGGGKFANADGWLMGLQEVRKVASEVLYAAEQAGAPRLAPPPVKPKAVKLAEAPAADPKAKRKPAAKKPTAAEKKAAARIKAINDEMAQNQDALRKADCE